MQPEAFEQLVNAWLDEPNPAQAARITAAIAETPALAELHDRLMMLDRAVRGLGERPLPIDWQRLAARLASTAAADKTSIEPSDQRLDELLAGLPQAEARVDWPRLHRRIVSAAHGGGTGRRRWSLAAAGLLAAAACAGLLTWRWLLPSPGAPPAIGSALVAVVAPAAPISGGYARVRIEAPAGPIAAAPAVAAQGEIFLMIGPAEPRSIASPALPVN